MRRKHPHFRYYFVILGFLISGIHCSSSKKIGTRYSKDSLCLYINKPASDLINNLKEQIIDTIGPVSSTGNILAYSLFLNNNRSFYIVPIIPSGTNTSSKAFNAALYVSFKIRCIEYRQANNVIDSCGCEIF